MCSIVDLLLGNLSYCEGQNTVWLLEGKYHLLVINYGIVIFVYFETLPLVWPECFGGHILYLVPSPQLSSKKTDCCQRCDAYKRLEYGVGWEL